MSSSINSYFSLGVSYHEKHPQYPIYRLPFKGDSIYRESFRRKLNRGKGGEKEIRPSYSNPALNPEEIKKKVSADHIKQNFSQIKMLGKYKQVDPTSVRNSDVYMAKSMKPKAEVVENMNIPAHFKTIYRNEFIKKPIIKRKAKKKPLVW